MSLSSFHGGHSTYSGGPSTVLEIAAAAAERGMAAFGFTEHFQIPPMALSPDMGLHDQLSLFDDYVADVETARERYPFVLLSAELEYIRGARNWTREQIARWPFDYLVGSVHYVRLDDKDYLIDWERACIDEAIERAGGVERLQIAYYEQVLELIDWRLTRLVGHLDLIKMLLTPEEAAPTPAIESVVEGVLEAIRDAGMAMDVNARGLLKPCRRIYPDDWVLERACRIGVPVTLGDDSHRASDVGLNLDVAIKALARAGYDRVWLVRPGGILEPSPLPFEA